MFEVGAIVQLSKKGESEQGGRLSLISRVVLTRLKDYKGVITECLGENYVGIQFLMPNEEKTYWDQGSFIVNVDLLQETK